MKVLLTKSRIGRQIGSSSTRFSRLGTKLLFEMSQRSRRAGYLMALCPHIIRLGGIEIDLLERDLK